MSILARAAAFAATLTLVAASRGEAQSSSTRVTIGGGPHAGTHELKDEECSVLDGKITVVFTATGGTVGDKTPEFIEFWTLPAKGKPDGFGVRVMFLTSGRQVVYEIHSVPAGVRGPVAASGSGSVTVKKVATGSIATFRGKTKDGVPMEGTVNCRTAA